MKQIKTKVVRMVLLISLLAILILGIGSAVLILNLRARTSQSLEDLNTLSSSDSSDALQKQKQEELLMLAEDKSSIADTKLQLILNQTSLVALSIQELFTNQDLYLQGKDWKQFPTQAFDFSCNYPEQFLGSFSIHIRAPRSVMDPSSIVIQDGTVVKAELDPSLLSDKSKKEMFLAQNLRSALTGILNFDNGDGTYEGIGATYFCFDSSGIDVLSDTLTTKMVEYDARNSAWYKGAKQLENGQVFWTKPVMDGSGRGVALICAMPVYIDGEFLGVAGSGGLIDNIRELVQSTTIGNSGYAFLVNTDSDGVVNLIANANKAADSEIAQNKDHLELIDNETLRQAFIEISKGKTGISNVVIDGKESFMAYSPLTLTKWTMVTVIGLDDNSIMEPIVNLQTSTKAITEHSVSEMTASIKFMFILFIVLLLVVIVIIVACSNKFSTRLVHPILQLTDGVKTVSSGDLNYKIKLSSDDEIELLGNSFNHMTDSLKEYIENLSKVTADRERIGAELNVATQIQASMLPCIFPAFPERAEFDIHASMQPAKEVGGDFYDFFLIDPDHLAIVIADVSGKGVPAALFMVIAKTLIKDQAMAGHNPAYVFTTVNSQLSETNEAEMFVTGWMGILEISTGKFLYVNAGHNPPLLKRKDGQYEYLKSRAGFVLAGMPNTKYKLNELQLEAGDKLFLYTDGVTEATDSKDELYGEDRLSTILNSLPEATSQSEILSSVSKDIEDFVQEAPQFDDITMLGLTINKEHGRSLSLTLQADVNELSRLLEFTESKMEEHDVPQKTIMQMSISIEEIFVNIAHYAFGDKGGKATVGLVFNDETRRMTITFTDSGMPYNPLEREDPDITLKAEDRKIGGLGIYMTKKSVDNCSYENRNGRNVLTLIKNY